jgi:hypothetical protein
MVQKFTADVTSWGCLVKSWATDLDYVGTGAYDSTAFAAQPPRPPWVTPAVSAEGKPWALPTMTQVDVPAEGGGTVALPNVIGMTVAQFTARLTSAKVADVFVPAQYTKVVIVQGSTDTIVVRLPPRDILQASEDDIVANGYGDLPNFYQELYTEPGTTPIGPFPPTDRGGEMLLHANRIGDYTMQNCN